MIILIDAEKYLSKSTSNHNKSVISLTIEGNSLMLQSYLQKCMYL